MNIPFFQIYNYISSLLKSDTTIYRFFPHGSKNIEDLGMLYNYHDRGTDLNHSIAIIMHDQEPLDFDLYNHSYIEQHLEKCLTKNKRYLTPSNCNLELLKLTDLIELWKSENLNFILHGVTTADRNIICHSEKRSTEVEKYKSVGLEPMYYWSHALIARDWYRYAEIDPELQPQPDQYKYDFVVYNRAWTGSREYRLKFADLVLENSLHNYSNIRFNPWDGDCHYQSHAFKNPNFAPSRELDILPLNLASAESSADYSSLDYQQCWFDVVLETLFDDSRLHLTEKILRPIACGKPFLLCATPGSLEYLRSYGFKTFDGIIDESYDIETDPVKRLQKIINCMKSISQLTPNEKKLLNKEINLRTHYNQQMFFSDKFLKQVIGELVDNYLTARENCATHRQGKNQQMFLDACSQIPNIKNELLRQQHVRLSQGRQAID
jgi:hypothetical protein